MINVSFGIESSVYVLLVVWMLCGLVRKLFRSWEKKAFLLGINVSDACFPILILMALKLVSSVKVFLLSHAVIKNIRSDDFI